MRRRDTAGRTPRDDLVTVRGAAAAMGIPWRMTLSMDPGADAVLELDESAPAEVALPTVPVLARVRSEAPNETTALAEVTRRLAPTRGLFDQVRVERREDDGSFWVVARFVTVSVDVHTAVVGVHETLQRAGVEVDEVWAEPAAT
jgi:hypothetical protein